MSSADRQKIDQLPTARPCLRSGGDEIGKQTVRQLPVGLSDEGIFNPRACTAEIIDVTSYDYKVVNQCNRGNLFVYGMFVVRRHQSTPHLSAFFVEVQYPVSVACDNQIEPFFQFLGLGHVAAMPNVLQSSPNFTDCLHG